ncbi:hypothetical protein C8R48DRAFT_767439 [Suillus tomentosus]|nr:hypothetical protein C8R48DRAFT_767439 [Suillus tomentosus]
MIDMPPIQHNQGEDFTQEIDDIDSNSTDSDGTDSLGDSDLNNDADLLQIWDVVVAPAATASTQDLCKHQETLKKVTFLKATVSKGQKMKLTKKDLALAAKEDSIRNFRYKFSITHCLQVETSIFPLCRAPPRIDLLSKERWLSLLLIQDSIKAELFQFIPPADHNMMAHKNFGSHFVKGVNNVHAEMLLDIKSCAAAIFVPTPKTKAKIQESRTATPGLIAAAAVIAIFVLSGDKELVKVGDKSRIPYKDYHNYYQQSLLTRGAWADGVFNFFNNSLFATSSSIASSLLNSDLLVSDSTSGPHDSWKEMFECAMETGAELPELDVSPVIEVPPSAPSTAPQSISAVMQGLALAEDHCQDPLPAAVNEDEPELPALVLEAPVAAQKPKPKPKPRQKGKADITNTNTSEDQGLANFEPLSA